MWRLLTDQNISLLTNLVTFSFPRVDVSVIYQLKGTLTTEMGNMNRLGKLLCTHCLNPLMDFAF